MSRATTAAVVVAICMFAVAYLAPMTRGKGTEMEEGAVVAYAERVLDGAVPHRDFLTFYGPANPWVVAGAFTAFGESVGTERGVGLAYRLVIVVSLILIGFRLAGFAAGALAGVGASVFMGQEPVWAYATYGAIAFGLLGIALTTEASIASSKRRQFLMLVAGGLMGGIAVLFRTEFAPAVLLGVLPVLTLVQARRRWWYAGGLVGAMAVYAVHLAVVGPERIVRVISDLVSSGSGRRLPVPGLSEYLGRLFAVSLVVLLALLAVGALLWWRSRDRPAPQLLVAVALFGFAAIPYVLSRPDVLHVRPFAVLPLSLLPALLLVGIDALLTRERARRGLVAAIAALTVAVVVHEGDFSVDRTRELRNVRSTYRGFVDDDSRHATGVVIARLRALARPGDSLFVGPLDLRRTNYGPTYMYFVLDDLEPASYYMEMNPGSANREGSGLADELRRADWLILTSEWDNWSEDNESAENGSAEPNEVVSDEFCLTVARGQYRLYERCDRAA